MSAIFDLLGDPIPEGWNKRGRPPHLATERNRNKIIMLLAFGWSNERVARAVGVTVPTLRKHYFAELKVRDEARDRMDATIADRLWTEAMGGNVGAIKEFRKLVERNDLMVAGRAYTGQPETPRPAKPPKLGKKDQARLDARTVPEGSGWDSLLRRH